MAGAAQLVGIAFDLWRAERAGPDGIRQRQRERLDDLVRFARDHSTFYRERFADVPVGRVSLEHLRPVTKHELIRRYDDWITDPAATGAALWDFALDPARIEEDFLGRYMTWTTSGSSGVLGIFLQDALASEVLAALNLGRGYLPHARPSELAARTWRSLRGRERQAWIYIAEGRTPEHAVIRRRRRNPRYARQSQIISVLEPTPALVERLNQYQPTVLGSYPSTVALLAEEQLAGRLRIRPRVVTMGGENVDDATRERIRNAFGVAAHEQYSTAETGSIAFRCHAGWFHVNDDWVVLEPVDAELRPVPPGTASHSVLVTSLANRVQPIIRYQLNDSVVVAPAPCPCGSPLTAVRVEGRVGDPLTFPTTVGSTADVPRLGILNLLRYRAEGIHRFQVIQTAPSTLEVRLQVRDGHDAERVWQDVEGHLHSLEATHGLVPLRVTRSAELPRPDPRSGKFPQVWSTVQAQSRTASRPLSAPPG